jgi:hypothetical protein
MRKLLFTFALLLCSTQVTAQTCSSLSGACLKLTTSSSSESLGPIEYSSALPFSFQTTFWVGQDQVSGQCFSGHSFFFRIHNGAVIATFGGSLAQNALSGTVSRPGKADTPWKATFVSCPSQNNFSTCGRNCALAHCPGGKPPCSPCYAKCLAACHKGKTDDPTCED